MNRLRIVVFFLCAVLTIHGESKIWFQTDDNQLLALTPRQVKRFRTLELMVSDTQMMNDENAAKSSKKDPFPISYVSKQDIQVLLDLSEAIKNKTADQFNHPYLLDKLPVSRVLSQETGIVRLIKAANFLDAKKSIVSWLNDYLVRIIESSQVKIIGDLGFPAELVAPLTERLIKDISNDLIIKAYELGMVNFREAFTKGKWEHYDYASEKNLFAVRVDKQRINLIDGMTGKIVEVIELDKPYEYAIINKKGTVIIAFQDRELIVWDIASKQIIFKQQMSFPIMHLIANSKGTTIVAIGDNNIVLVRRSKNAALSITPLLTGPVRSSAVAITSEGDYVAFYDQTSKDAVLYTVKTGNTIRRRNENVSQIVFDELGRLFAVVSPNRLELFSYTFNDIKLLAGSGVIKRISFDPYGFIFAVLYGTSKVDIVSQKDFTKLRRFIIHEDNNKPIRYLEFLPDGYKIMLISKTSVGFLAPFTLLDQLKELSLEQAVLLAKLKRVGFKLKALTPEDLNVLATFNGDLADIIKALIKKPSLWQRINKNL